MRLPGASNSSERHFEMPLILIPFWQNSVYLFFSKCMWPSQHSLEILRARAIPPPWKFMIPYGGCSLARFSLVFMNSCSTPNSDGRLKCMHSLPGENCKQLHPLCTDNSQWEGPASSTWYSRVNWKQWAEGLLVRLRLVWIKLLCKNTVTYRGNLDKWRDLPPHTHLLLHISPVYIRALLPLYLPKMWPAYINSHHVTQTYQAVL